MGIGSFLGKTALRELLKHSPQILDAAAKLRQGRNGEAEGLAQLEGLVEEQRALLAQLADQLHMTSAALDDMRRQLRVAIAVAGAGFVVAATALAAALLR